MLVVTKNTYPIDPKYPNVPHANIGDIVHWEARNSKGMQLIRNSDGKCVFVTAPINKDGLRANGKPPILIGIIAQIKKRGWYLTILNVEAD